MIPHNLRKCLKTLFATIDVANYYIDECPPFDSAPNKNGFFVWDTEDHVNDECSEGLGYSGPIDTGDVTENFLTIHFVLEVTCYSNRFATRSDTSTLVMDLFYPVTSGVRIPLRGTAITDGFINHVKHVSTTEFDVQKTGQSTPEMSASVMTFECSFSVKEI